VSRAVYRRLRAALQPRTGRWLETVAVLRLPPTEAPLWTPGPSYVEAMTATVWARRISGGDAHAVVRTYGSDGTPVLSRGIVAAGDVWRLGGLTDKPHRIRWLGRNVTTEPVGNDHPAVAYHDWVLAIADRLEELHWRLLRRRFLHGQQLRVKAAAGGRFHATVDIEIETGAYLRHDVTAHTAALSGLLRDLGHLGRGARLRFYPRHHPAADPLDAHAYQLFAR
jgi:hypothetical protein